MVIKLLLSLLLALQHGGGLETEILYCTVSKTDGTVSDRIDRLV